MDHELVLARNRLTEAETLLKRAARTVDDRFEQMTKNLELSPLGTFWVLEKARLAEININDTAFDAAADAAIDHYRSLTKDLNRLRKQFDWLCATTLCRPWLPKPAFSSVEYIEVLNDHAAKIVLLQNLL